MSTNATISIKKDGRVHYVYCHWDGYISDVGQLLFKYYNTLSKVKELVALGNISSLDKSIACPEGHSFDTRIKGYTTFYGRDRGETEQEACVVFMQAYKAREYSEQEYNYLFYKNEWLVLQDGVASALASCFSAAKEFSNLEE